MQADRVRDFMNYQITTVMEEYTPDFDQLLFYVGYGGSAFKKIYYDFDKGRMVSRLIPADNLYIPYNGSSVMSECERISYKFPMSVNAYRKAVARGQYLDIAEPTTTQDQTQIEEAKDKLVGQVPAGDEEEMTFIEFQVDYDLPGFEHTDEEGEATGIKLPYVITIDGRGREAAQGILRALPASARSGRVWLGLLAFDWWSVKDSIGSTASVGRCRYVV